MAEAADTLKLGINGFGRTGRMVLRASLLRKDIEVIAVNDPFIPPHNMVYQFKYDSAQGQFDGNVSTDGKNLIINGQTIIVNQERSPKDIPWGKQGVVFVAECTGIFKESARAAAVDAVFRAAVSAAATAQSFPSSPLDVRTSAAEFSMCLRCIQSAYNNPRGLFKVLRDVATKLKLSAPKYRLIDPANPAVRRKVLQRHGLTDKSGPDAVLEFLRLLGFVTDIESGVMKCPRSQPPLSVIDAATTVCARYIDKQPMNSGKPLTVNKRPKDDTSDDDDEANEAMAAFESVYTMAVSQPQPQRGRANESLVMRDGRHKDDDQAETVGRVDPERFDEMLVNAEKVQEVQMEGIIDEIETVGNEKEEEKEETCDNASLPRPPLKFSLKCPAKVPARAKNGKGATLQEFESSASDIACSNPRHRTGRCVFSSLDFVAKKLLKDDVRYQTLDTTNPYVQRLLFGFESFESFESVLGFLKLLGFESDVTGAKLICEDKPSRQVVYNAYQALKTYCSSLSPCVVCVPCDD